MAREELIRLLEQVERSEVGLAEAVRRAVELRRKLQPTDPDRARLEPLVAIDERFDLARAGYGDLEAVTAEMRAAFVALRQALQG